MASPCLFTAEHHLPLICCRDIRAVARASGGSPSRTVSGTLRVSHPGTNMSAGQKPLQWRSFGGFFSIFLILFVSVCDRMRTDDGPLTLRLASAADICEFQRFLAFAIDTEMSILLIPNVSVLSH